MFKRNKNRKCNNILRDIISSKEIHSIYRRRVKDSIMQNEGNMMQVYQEISYVISKDYDEKDMDVCSRVSLAVVTLMRSSANDYNDLEFRYHG